jgi:large subunit ribosomal protein L47
MRAIKHTLTERFYAWEDAVKLAENDPEVNLTGNGPAFTPSDYLEETETETAAVEGEQHVAEAAEETAEKAEPAAAAPDPATIPSSKPQAEAPRL